LNAAVALRNSDRHRLDRLLYLGRVTDMKHCYQCYRRPMSSAANAVQNKVGIFKLEDIYRSCRRNRWGAAAVEFAIVAPVFFLLVFGMIEYGRMVMVQQVITNAAREGARVGVLDGATTSNVTTAVSSYLTSARISGASTSVSPSPPSSASYGAPVTVTVSV